ncbi:hypothetical protein NP493_380g01015 [Ridgeia piscesae]|uniref:Protein tyrosine phosphatase n=1 Tax=Ridgeia piscesae TaxID=27915 RepID=A0AAD9NV40_RIDPI|nr:hypothetical protein NP493_380g01015 [Ridgeia piscesae]
MILSDVKGFYELYYIAKFKHANFPPRQGYNSKREYAVVQGPLPATVNDFWRLVWEQKARAIVMLTKCVEMGKDKCECYWPVDKQPMYYGDLKVVVFNVTKSTDWVVTTIEVSMGINSHKLSHYQFTAWPDVGVPEEPQSFVGFVRLVRRNLESSGSPIVVHGSAGVGRSGTFIVLDRLIQHVEEHDWLDVYSTVAQMRLFRMFMVQTEVGIHAV